MSGPDRHRHRGLWPAQMLQLITILMLLLPSICALHHMRRDPVTWVASRATSSKPLFVQNKCGEVIYPAILTQAGTGPSTTGFKLSPGASMSLSVSADWQGRVWGRTNCTFNSAGTGPDHSGGVNGNGAACVTGDCGGTVQCQLAVHLPFPPDSYTLRRKALTSTTRAPPPPPLPSSHLPPVKVKPSMTSP